MFIEKFLKRSLIITLNLLPNYVWNCSSKTSSSLNSKLYFLSLSHKEFCHLWKYIKKISHQNSYFFPGSKKSEITFQQSVNLLWTKRFSTLHKKSNFFFGGSVFCETAHPRRLNCIFYFFLSQLHSNCKTGYPRFLFDFISFQFLWNKKTSHTHYIGIELMYSLNTM